MDTGSDNNYINSSKIQHVTKKSSDELLRKFAEVGSEKEDKAAAKKEQQLAKRLKRSSSRTTKPGPVGFSQGRMYIDQSSSLNGTNASIVEMKSLLPPAPVTCRRSGKLARRLGIGKAKVRAREIKNRSIISAIEKVRFSFQVRFYHVVEYCC